ncbi:MAG: cupin domain-containing protein [Polyangiales bacterium]
MSTRDPHELDDFLASAGDVDALVALAEALPPSGPEASGRARLLGLAAPEGRLDRFAADVARLLDLAPEAASALLARASTPAPYEPGPFPGVSLFHVVGGPAVAGAITGFVRLVAGAEFPEHEHLGDEAVLILQGRLIDSGGAERGPGEVVPMPAGSRHGVVAKAGPDLVYLAVLREGLRIGDVEMRADDPRL